MRSRVASSPNRWTAAMDAGDTNLAPAGWLVQHLRSRSRSTKLWMLAGVDLLLLVLAAWLAFSVRLGDFFEPSVRVLGMMGVASGVSVAAFHRLGLYRPVIRFIGPALAGRVAQGMTVSALIWVLLGFMTQFAGYENVPRSMPLIFGVHGWVFLCASRYAARWLLWRPAASGTPLRKVLIYGAGGAGRQLAASLCLGRELRPVAFVDADSALAGCEVDGLRVHAPAELAKLVEVLEIDEVIVTTEAVPASRRREIVEEMERCSIRVRVLPALADIASGRHVVNLVRDVDIDDLLGRDPVTPDPALLAACITGKVVLVTGAGGSIGSEICRQVAALAPQRLVLLEASEHALYEIDRRLRQWEACDIVPVLGSVQNRTLVESLLAEHNVETIYHTAAHKHVPLVQSNPLEGAANNVLGTLTVAEAAFEAGVGTFVLISSDKAVRPTSVMGATKRWAELIVQQVSALALERGAGQHFCAVRFGNVLGSNGSVVPLFKEQIARGGPVTVTHPEVTRYFMSIHEAVALVIQAGSLARSGEVFMIDMGEPVRIIDLARKMITLAGLTVRGDGHHHPEGALEIRCTGLRPGEKLFEELLIRTESTAATAHPKIMKIEDPAMPPDLLRHYLLRLTELIHARQQTAITRLLLAVAMWTPSEVDGPDRSEEPVMEGFA